MALYPITVNTPAADPAHIFAEDDAAIYEGLIGTDRVLNIGNKLNTSVITNNKVRVSDGVVVVGGHVARIKKGDYQDMTIANGVSGKKRNDIIAARFMTTGSGGTDTYKLVVLQGAAGTTATDPAVVKGNLYAGDAQRDYPLWRVHIDGLSIVKVEQMYEIGMSNKDLSDTLKELNSKLDGVSNPRLIYSGGFYDQGKTYNFDGDNEIPDSGLVMMKISLTGFENYVTWATFPASTIGDIVAFTDYHNPNAYYQVKARLTKRSIAFDEIVRGSSWASSHIYAQIYVTG